MRGDTMKYSSTIRMINAIVFALLIIGFACLGIYFGLIAAPNLLPRLNVVKLGETVLFNSEYSYALAAMLGGAGLACTAIAVYGLVMSIRSIMDDRNDVFVLRSFLSYIALGYVLVIYFFINAVWLFRLTAGTEANFVIIIYLLVTVVLLIATNVPLFKLLENENQNLTMKTITGACASVATTLALIFCVSAISFAGTKPEAGYSIISSKLVVYLLLALAASALAICSFVFFSRNVKKGETKVSILASNLFAGSLVASAVFFIVSGSFVYAWNYDSSKNVSFLNKTLAALSKNVALNYAVAGWILGAALIAAAAVIVVLNYVTPKKKVREVSGY